MKKFLKNKITMISLLVVSVLFLGFYVYMIARPISYGMVYTSKIELSGKEYVSKNTYYRDNIVKTEKSDGDEFTSYYYKEGRYIVFVSDSKAEYEEIIKTQDMSQVIKEYGEKMNAFCCVSSIDGEKIVSTCYGAIWFAVIAGVFELALITLAILSTIYVVKNKKSIENNIDGELE